MTPIEPMPAQASLPNSYSYTLRSNALDEALRIDVAPPLGFAANQAALPAVYVLDGNGMFALVAQTVRLLEIGNELPPLLIVGVGYATDSMKDVMTKRMRDLTPSFAEVPGEGSAGGGADAFLTFINAQLKPFIAERFNVDAKDSTIVGDSLGGLFALHTLFTQPASFDRYVAGSPSLWWDNGLAFRQEAECAARSPKLASRLFMSVDGLEEDPNNDRLRPFAMVSNLERMTSTLQRRAYPGLKLDTVVFPAETHLSVIPATMSRGLRSVFRDA